MAANYTVDISQFLWDGGETYQEDCSDHHRILIRGDWCQWSVVLDGHDTVLRGVSDSPVDSTSVFFRSAIWQHFTEEVQQSSSSNEDSWHFALDVPALLEAAVDKAQAAYARHFADGRPSGGTTLTGVFMNLASGAMIVFNLGDSRVHMHPTNNESLYVEPQWATRDHTASGVDLSDFKDWRHIQRSSFLKSELLHVPSGQMLSLGGALGDVNRSFSPVLDRHLRTWNFSMEAGEGSRYGILASDGFWDILSQSPESIRYLFTPKNQTVQIGDLERWVRWCTSNVDGAWDNVCVVMWHIHPSVPPSQDVQHQPCGLTEVHHRA